MMGTGTDPGARAERLRALHVPGRPLILANAWDASSARTVEAAGFPAVATSSAAVAAALGYKDGEAPPDEMLAAAGRIVRVVAVPVTVDLEAGYGWEPRDLVERLIQVGAAGCNLEDTDHASGRLADASAHAGWLGEVCAAARGAGVPLVINARTDVFIHGRGRPEAELVDSAIDRGRRYLEAGADCVFPIFAAEEVTIGNLVKGMGGPVNVLFRPAVPALARLAELGVARVSLGGGLGRVANAAVRTAVERLAAGDAPW